MKKNTLVILAGIPRGGQESWNSINKYLINSHNADLAILTEEKYIKKYTITNAKYYWSFKSYNNWEDYYLENDLNTALNYLKKGKQTGLFNSGIIVFALKDIVKNNYLEILNQYDQIFFSRFDQYFVANNPILDNDYVWFVEGEDYGGINDRHFAFPSKYSEKILGICDYINTTEALNEIPKFPNCESVWMEHLKYSGLDIFIKRFERTQFTVSKKDDFTRWRIAKYNLFFYKDIKIKYPSEFITTVKNLLTARGSISVLKSNPLILFNYYVLKLRGIIGPFLPLYLRKSIKKFLNIY
jgi:hypothetical protein